MLLGTLTANMNQTSTSSLVDRDTTRVSTYISVDVEADGPCPGINSMLSLGAYAFSVTKEGVLVELGTFSVNVEQMTEASPDERTMNVFWKQNPEAWALCRKDVVTPSEGLAKFHSWLKEFKGPTFVGNPAGFDFTFVRWYLYRFVGECAFGFAAIDLRSYAAGMLGKPANRIKKKKLKKRFGIADIHTHVALDDAIEQGRLFAAMVAENESYKK